LVSANFLTSQLSGRVPRAAAIRGKYFRLSVFVIGRGDEEIALESDKEAQEKSASINNSRQVHGQKLLNQHITKDC